MKFKAAVKNAKVEDSGAKKILSASELGLKAESLGIKKTAKSFRGRKILQQREPQIKEGIKQSVMLRGNKISNDVQ